MKRFLFRSLLRSLVFGALALASLACIWFFFPRLILRPFLQEVARKAYRSNLGFTWDGLEATTPLNFSLSDLALSHRGHAVLTARGLHLSLDPHEAFRGRIFLRSEVEDAWVSLPLLGALKESLSSRGAPSPREGETPWFSLRSARISKAVIQLGPTGEGLVVSQATLFTPEDAPFGDLSGRARFTVPARGKGSLEALLEANTGRLETTLRFEDLPLDRVKLQFWNDALLSGSLDGRLSVALPPPYLFELDALRGKALLRDGVLERDEKILASKGRVQFELGPRDWTLDGSLQTHGGELSARSTFPLDFHRFAIEGQVHDASLEDLLTHLPPLRGTRRAGQVRGSFRGALEGDRRELALELRSQNASIGEYRPASLVAAGVWTEGALLLENFDLRLAASQRGRLHLQGNGCGRPTTDTPFVVLSAELEDLPLLDPLHVVLDDRNLRGRLSAHAFAHVPLDRLDATEAHGKLRVAGLALGNEYLGDLQTEFRLRPERSELRKLVFEDSPSPVPALEISVDCPARGLSTSRIQLARFRLGETPLGKASLNLDATIRGHLPKGREGANTGLARLLAAAVAMRRERPQLSWDLRSAQIDLDGKEALKLTTACHGEARGDDLSLSCTAVEFFGAPLRFDGSTGKGRDGLQIRLGPVQLSDLAERFLPRERWSAHGRMDGEWKLKSIVPTLEADGHLSLGDAPSLAYWNKEGKAIYRSELHLPEMELDFRMDGSALEITNERIRFRRDETSTDRAWTLQLKELPGHWLRERLPDRLALVDLGATVTGSLIRDRSPEDRFRGSLAVEATNRSSSPGGPGRGRLQIDFSPEGFDLRDLVVQDGQGEERLRLALGARASRSSTLALDLNRFPTSWFADLGLDLPALDTIRTRVRGTLGPLGAGRGQLLAAFRDPARARKLFRQAGAELRVETLEARREGELVLEAPAPFGLRLRRGRLDFDAVHLRVGGRVLKLDGTAHLAGWTELRLESDHIPLAVLIDPLWGDRFRQVGGVLSGKLEAIGRIQAPRVTGKIDLDDLSFGLPYLDTRVEGRVRLRGGSEGLELRCPELRLGSRPLELEATLPMKAWTPQPFHARFAGENLVLERRGTRVEGIDVNLRLTGSVSPPRARLEGKVRVAGGRIALSDSAPIFIAEQLLLWKERMGEDENLSAVLSDATTSSASTGTSTGATVWPPVLEAELEFEVPGPLFLRNALLDVALAGQATVKRRGDGLTLANGELRVTRGAFFLHRTEFRIDRALVRFRPVGTGYEVLHELDAHATVRAFEVRIQVRGTAESPQVNLSSSPPLSEAELVHLLSTGIPPSEELSLSSVGSGVTDFYLTSSFNRFLSDALGVSALRIRRGLDETRIDVDQRLGEHATVSYSRSDQEKDSLRLEFRLGGSTTIETGRSRDGTQVDSFFGFKRRIRLR